MKKISYQPLSNDRYQNPVSYKIEEQVVPQGLAYFTSAGKKHFPQQQRGELESYQGMQHLFDPPKRLINDYDRSLCTKDIDGAVTNTLKSKVVKNMELAQAYKQEKQKSLWESNKGPNEPEYQARKRWDDFDPYKNRSAIYTQNGDQKQQVSDIENMEKAISLNNTDKPDKLSDPDQQNRQQMYEQQIQAQQTKIQQSESSYQQDIQLHEYQKQQMQFQQQQQYQQMPQSQNTIPPQYQFIQPQITQPISQQYYQQLQTSSSQPNLQIPTQIQEQPRYVDDDRQRQQQLLMQKQWDIQKQEGALRHQQYQNEKLLEQKQIKQQYDMDQHLIDQQRKNEANLKQQYARDLRMQQESNRDGVSRKGFTPPPVSKSEMINQLLQQPAKMLKSQGFDEHQQQQNSPQQIQKDSLSKEIEELDKKMVINRYRPHELQQYIYDMRNGRIGGSRTRNNPTFMSYAGQQLVNQ